MNVTHVLGDIEDRLARGERMARRDVERVLQCPDLVSIGVVGDQARRALTGARVTFGRVLDVQDRLPSTPGAAGEIRLLGMPSSIEEARVRVRNAAAWAGGRPVTGFALADLATASGGDMAALSALAADLVADGLVAVAEVGLDQAASDEVLIEQLRAVLAGGLGAWRATVGEADLAARVDLIERACTVQQATGAFRAFAPLPRRDRTHEPSTGYDDVKTVAAARLRCREIELIQVDWPLYGPKLAQVALTFGANDIDGIEPFDTDDLGPRRAPVADIRRQIMAAAGDPVERDAHYRPRG